MKLGASQVLLRNDFLRPRQCWHFEFIIRDAKGVDMNYADVYCSLRDDGMQWLQNHVLGKGSSLPMYLHLVEQSALDSQIQYYMTPYFDNRRFAIFGSFHLGAGRPVLPGRESTEFKVSANDSAFSTSFLLSHRSSVFQSYDPATDDYTGNPTSATYASPVLPRMGSLSDFTVVSDKSDGHDLLDMVPF